MIALVGESAAIRCYEGSKIVSSDEGDTCATFFYNSKKHNSILTTTIKELVSHLNITNIQYCQTDLCNAPAMVLSNQTRLLVESKGSQLSLNTSFGKTVAEAKNSKDEGPSTPGEL